MANYDNIPSIAVIYEGLLETFTNLTDKSEYYGRVVFITGNAGSDTAKDRRQAIWVSQDDGSNAHFLNMSDTDTIASTLSYVKGIIVGKTTYPTIEGGSYLNLVGADGIEITVEPDKGIVTFSGKALSDAIATAQAAAEAADAKAAEVSSAVNELIGTTASDKGKSIRTIAGEVAENVGAAVTEALLGDNADGYTDDTIKGIKNSYVAKGYLFDENYEKIKLGLLPDAILGQLQFGGTIGNSSSEATSRTIVVTPSANYKDIFPLTGDEFSVTEDTPFFTPKEKQGWYFIVRKPNSNSVGNFGWGEKTLGDLKTYDEFFEIGDWFISNGVNWIKIDNTDSVTMVAGMMGNITTSSLVTKLSTANDENPDPLAKKSDIKIDSLQTIAKIDDTQTRAYFLTNRENDDNLKELTITATVYSMDKISKTSGNQGFADARDVYDFIKARLSIKVVK